MYSTTATDASNFVNSYNIAFYSIAIISLILLTGLTVTMLYFVFRYNKKKNKTAIQNEGNTLLEIIWTVIPILLVLVMFYFGWAGWKPMTKAPKEAHECHQCCQDVELFFHLRKWQTESRSDHSCEYSC